MNWYNHTQCFPYINSTWADCPGKLRPAQQDNIQIPFFSNQQCYFAAHTDHPPTSHMHASRSMYQLWPQQFSLNDDDAPTMSDREMVK